MSERKLSIIPTKGWEDKYLLRVLRSSTVIYIWIHTTQTNSETSHIDPLLSSVIEVHRAQRG